VNKLEVLKKCNLFRDLNDEQLNVVEKMSTYEVFEPGVVICKEGSKADKIWVIEEGLAAVILQVGPLAQRQLQSVSSSECFGWSAMIEPHARTSTVKAIRRTRVLAFSGQELCDLCRTDPEMGYKIITGLSRMLGTRLRHAFTQLVGVTSEDQ
jgi:CRP-like cAMP-binding protein